MKEIHLLSKNERGLFFKAASDIKEIPLEIIEKDYWVVWVLEGLFSLEKLSLTSPSKGAHPFQKYMD